MNLRTSSALFASVLSLSGLAALPARADQWTAPTPEELSMTSQKEVPGAPAVYLFREEMTEDKLHMFSVYVRLKVLTERGKEQGDIEIKYVAGAEGTTVDNIAGRTIHPDGTIIPFTGKPYEKLIEKSSFNGNKYQYKAKVFSMPAVEVGSIIEYRYKIRMDDYYFRSPDWYIQSDLFTRKAHYRWLPTTRELTTNDERGQLTSGVAWTPILPPDAKIVQTRLPGSMGGNDQLIFDLAVHDVAPAPDEEYMPPVASFTYRVLFYYSAYRNMDEFWKNEGKFWSKKRDRFIGPGPGVNAAVAQIVAPGDAPDVKLRKIYAAVQQLENTHYTRTRSNTEDKAQGLGEIKSTDDILQRKRGNEDQIAQLFVAMARAAGFKAYLMAVTNRDRHLFAPMYLSLSQLDDYVAVVNVDGKERFFDPGSRYCPYGHLEWKHNMASGIRQSEGGVTTLTNTPFEPYTNSRVQRVANLNMDEHGTVTGTVKLTFAGDPALRWRHTSLEGDEEGLRQQLRLEAEQLLPHSMEVKVASIEKLTDYEQPLVVNFNVKGVPGSATGKRLLMPGDIFTANSKPTFPHEHRDSDVYFPYSHMVQDAVRVNFPAGFTIESLPAAFHKQYKSDALYQETTESTPTSYTIRRNYTLGGIIFPNKEYADLRTFYNGVEANDQQPVVLKLGASSETKASNTGGN